MKPRIRILFQRIRLFISAYLPGIERIFYKLFYKPSAGSLSFELDQFSKEANGEIKVLQVGANDGLINDPIHKFIVRDKWVGVLLEPQAGPFATLKKIYRSNKRIKPVQAALGNADGKSILYCIAFSKMRWASGLSSFVRQNLIDAFESGYVKSLANKHNITIPEEKNDQIAEQEIQVLTFSSLDNEYAISKTDILVTDTEGFDHQIIQLALSFGLIPQGILFENKHLGDKDLKNTLNLISEHGYIFKHFGGDTFARKSDKMSNK